MNLATRHPRACAAAIVLALGAAACTDALTSSNGPRGTPGDAPTGPPGVPILLSRVDCTVAVQTKTVTCGAPALPDGVRGDIIYGGQNQYVTVASSNPDYNTSTQQFTFDLTVRNLIPQPIGTTDGVAVDPNGVRVFFQTAPVATSGSGTITVVGDGVANFTAASQPYYQYNAMLAQYQVSVPKTWKLNVPNTVGTFSFGLLVSAPVQFPNGYVDIMGNYNVRSGNDRTLTAVVRDALGEIDAGAVVTGWTPSDALLASVAANGNPTQTVVHGLRAGAPVINVSATRTVGGAPVAVVGKVTMNVAPIRRYWTGAVNTDWQTGGNWLPDNVVPVATDTAVVTDTIPSTNFPILSQNTQIGGVEVLDLTPGAPVIPTVNLAAFNLDASGDVLVTQSASITNTSGVLVLTGTGRTVEGTLPAVRVTGSYSLTGNINTRAALRVDLGRLTNTRWRIQTLSF